MSSDGTEHDLQDIKSKIEAAKFRIRLAAKYEEDPEQRAIYQHHYDELAIAIEKLEQYIETGTDQ